MDVTADLARKRGTDMPQGLCTLDILKKAVSDGYVTRDMASILNDMREK